MPLRLSVPPLILCHGMVFLSATSPIRYTGLTFLLEYLP